MTQTIEIDGFDQLPGVFDDIALELDSVEYTEPLRDFTKVLEDKHQAYFDSQSGPSGQAWAPWHLRALDAGDSHPTLNVSGALRRSLTRGGSDHIEEVTSNSLTWGTSVVYSGINNRGGVIEAKVPLVIRGGKGFIPAGTLLHIPQREHVGMNDETLQILVDDTADKSVEAMKNV